MTVSMILRMVDQITGPHKRVIASVRQIGGAVDSAGAGMIASAGRMDDAIRTQKAHLAGAAFETAGWAAALYAGIKPAVEFEAAMDKVGAISRADDEDLRRLTATARELGATTPWAAREAAAGMEFLAMAGFDTNQIIATMPGMLNLASAAQMDLGATADIASNILTGFKLNAADMARVADVMTNTFTSSNVSLAMLGETMAYVGPDAAAAGLDIEQTAAMVGLLGNAGIQGSRAGTALRAMLARLAGPTGAAADALRQLNIQTTDSAGNLRPLPDILADMDRAMQGLGSAARTEMRATIFGLEAATAAGVLMGEAGSGALGKYAETLYEAGSAARVAAEQTDNAMGMLKRAQSVMEAIAITAGTVLLPGLVELGDAVIPILERVNAWAAANPELVATLGKLAVGLLVARIGMIGLRFALLTLVQPFAGILRFSGLLLRGLGLLAGFNPFGVLALAAVAAWYVIRDNWGQIVSWFTTKVDAVRAAFDLGFVQGLTALLAEFNPFTVVFEALDGLVAYAGAKLGEIAARIDAAFSGVAKYEAGKLMLQSLWDGASSIVAPFTADMRTRLAGFLDGVSLFDAGAALIRSLWEGAKSLVLDMVADLRARIEGILPNWAIRLLPDVPAVAVPAPAAAIALPTAAALPPPAAAVAAPREGVIAPPRAPITPADVAPRTTHITRTGDIIVNAPEGADPKAIAREVKAVIDAAGAPAREQDLHDASGDELWP